MIRYTFVIFLSLVFFVPSAYSTNTDEAKLKSLETKIKKLEQERKKLNNELGKYKNHNKKVKIKLQEYKDKKKKIETYRTEYDKRYGKSKVDEKLTAINRSIKKGEKIKKHDEEQIAKGTKNIEKKDKVITDKKIEYERMKHTLIEKKNKVTIYIEEYNLYIEAGDNIKYYVQEKHLDGENMGTGTNATSKDLAWHVSERLKRKGMMVGIIVKENGREIKRYNPKYSTKTDARGIEIKDKFLGFE
jgi:hypothetical protein